MKRYSTRILLLIIIVFAGFLRIYDIAYVPPGLYIDEASIAYNAYSILTTGKDEHGLRYPLFFQAFGEYKMPVYIYLTALSFELFGKNEFAVRIPSAFFGTMTVVLFYFFAKELIVYEKRLTKRQQVSFALVSTFLLSITPWHLQFSRAGFETTVGLFFYLAGLLTFLFYVKKKRTFLLFVTLTLIVVSLYTYDAYRIITPVSIICLLGYGFYIKIIRKEVLIKALIYLFILALPILLFSFSTEGLTRFYQTSGFTGGGEFAMFIYPMQYLQNYLSHFSLTFLFSYGDGIGRQSVFRMGELFKWELIFLLSGIYSIVSGKKTFFTWSLLFLLFVSPLAAALAVPSPHALRSLPLVLPLTLLAGYGIIRLLIHFKNSFLLFLVLGILVIVSFGFYLDRYYDFTAVSVLDWGGQYKELFQKLSEYDTGHNPVVVNTNASVQYVYAKFYTPALPVLFVNDTWKKPASWNGKTIFYVTPADQKLKNTFLNKYPHHLLDQITIPDKYKIPLYFIWKI